MTRITQRDAVAMSACCDRSEVTEYQYGRHRSGGVHLFDLGGGYACAVKAGKAVPGAFDEYGPWRKVDTIASWDVHHSEGV